jgi:hypothetical protein
VAVLFEILFNFKSCHAARSSGGDRLAVAAVLDVATSKDTGDDLAVVGGEDVVSGENVAVVVQVKDAFEGEGVGNVADGEEHKADGEDVLLIGKAVLEAEPLDVLLLNSENLFDSGVRDELDIRVSHRALEHDLAGAEPLGPVDNRDLGGEASQKKRLFHSRVAAADDSDLFTAGKEAVAGCAGGDAVADERLLGREIQPARARTRGDDERPCVDDLLAGIQLEGVLGEIDRGQVSHAELGAEACGLLLHVLNQLGPLDSLGPAGKVFDQGGDRELAAGLVALEDERLQVRTAGVDGRGKARTTGAEDNSVACSGFRHIGSTSVNARLVERIQSLLGWCGWENSLWLI